MCEISFNNKGYLFKLVNLLNDQVPPLKMTLSNDNNTHYLLKQFDYDFERVAAAIVIKNNNRLSLDMKHSGSKLKSMPILPKRKKKPSQHQTSLELKPNEFHVTSIASKERRSIPRRPNPIKSEIMDSSRRRKQSRSQLDNLLASNNTSDERKKNKRSLENEHSYSLDNLKSRAKM